MPDTPMVQVKDGGLEFSENGMSALMDMIDGAQEVNPIEKEAPPEPATEQRTEAVLVIDLVVGENLALNKALADGYEIVGRYAKQYTLEKKKPKEVQK